MAVQNPIHLHDFEIRFGPRAGDHYPLSVDCPSGRDSGSFRIPRFDLLDEPPTDGTSRGAPRDLVLDEPSPPPDAAVVEVGERLFRALITGRVRSLFDQSMGALGADQRVGLRLRLCFDPEAAGHPELLELPWEQLYWLERRQFLALDGRISIVRVLTVPHRRRTLQATPPVVVLLVAANPENTGTLAWRKDCQKIARALQNHEQVETHLLPEASAPALGDRLRQDGVHILHFVGHGTFDPGLGQGALILEDDHGQSANLEATRLADLCRGAPDLRLVVLSACHTARAPSGAGHDAFAGLTSALLMAGLPAVVSMAGPISDQAAITFNEAFYTSLGRGRRVERALIDGRLAIRASSGTAFEWTTPVLSMDAPEDRLFDFGAQNSTSGLFAPPAAASAPPTEKPRDSTRPASSNPSADSKLTWLHLSDLHLGSRKAAETKIALDSLIIDLEKQMTSTQARPDAIFVTGDVTWSGQPHEFELAATFFGHLLDTLKLSADRLFLVPGNHDVDWQRITVGMKAMGGALQNRDQVLEVLEDERDRSLLLSRLENYYQHVRSLAGAHGLDGDSLGYCHEMVIDGRTIAILGLNSAWLCEPGDDRARGLVLGEWQVRPLLERSTQADLRIALLHHPFDFLREFDRIVCEDLLSAGVDFVLHGHLHRAALHRLESPDSSAMVLAGGATWQSRTAVNAYNLVSLDLEAGWGEIEMRRYSDQGTGFWAPDTLRYKNAPKGSFGFQFRPSETVDPVEPAGAEVVCPEAGHAGFADPIKWRHLIRQIHRGSCIPIIGPELAESLVGSRRLAARRWASEHNYPLGPIDHVDLPQIAQYLSGREGEGFMRDELADFMYRELGRRHPDQLNGQTLADVTLDDVISRIGEQLLAPSLKVLASLPFSIYVSADPSSLLCRALERAGRAPRLGFSSWFEPFPAPETVFDREPDYEPSVAAPLIYQLFGRLDRPESLVLTEDNYFDFLLHHAETRDAIPGAVKSPLSRSALLFLGFELHSWDFRVLFRTLLRQQGDSRRDDLPHVAVQLNPMGDQAVDAERARRYLEHYFYKNAAISIYWGEVSSFLGELGERWETHR